MEKKMIDIKDMFLCGVHYGHRSCYSNPQMAEYVYAQKNDMQVIDLTKTAKMFTDALTFVDQLVRSGGRIVVVGTKQAAQPLVEKYGKEMGMPYVDQRWYGGTLTNFKTVRSSVGRLSDLEKRFQSSDFKGLTKKERLVLQRERAKLTLSLGGIRDLNTLPEAVFVLDVAQERIAIKEANKLGLPVVGIVDTNCSPEGVDYVIPGNDDAMSAIEYYLDCLSQVVSAAKADLKEREERQEMRNKPVIKKKEVKVESAEQPVDASKKVVKKVAKMPEEPEAPVKKVVKKVKKVEEKPAEKAKPAAKKAAPKTVAKKPAAKSTAKKAEEKAVKKPAAKKPAAKKPAAKKAATETKKPAAKKSTKE